MCRRADERTEDFVQDVQQTNSDESKCYGTQKQCSNETEENFRSSVINYQQSLTGCGHATHQGIPHAPNLSLKVPL